MTHTDFFRIEFLQPALVPRYRFSLGSAGFSQNPNHDATEMLQILMKELLIELNVCTLQPSFTGRDVEAEAGPFPWINKFAAQILLGVVGFGASGSPTGREPSIRKMKAKLNLFINVLPEFRWQICFPRNERQTNRIWMGKSMCCNWNINYIYMQTDSTKDAPLSKSISACRKSRHSPSVWIVRPLSNGGGNSIKKYQSRGEWVWTFVEISSSTLRTCTGAL